MTIFDHGLWPRLKIYARLSNGRDNLDLLQLPNDLRILASQILLPCVACGEPIRVFRARMKSKRSRIAKQVEERRMFYASTCPGNVNSGCARSTAAMAHKQVVRDHFGMAREKRPSIVVRIEDASGLVLYEMKSEVVEKFSVDLPAAATTIVFVPVRKDGP